MNTEKCISQIPLFQTLDDDDIHYLVESLRRRPLKKGEVLFRKGDEGSTLYVIKRGSVRIILPSRLGDEMAPAILSEGDFFGEMALFDGMPRSADVVAIEDTELLALNRSDFLRFIRGKDRAIESVLTYLSLRLRRTDDLLGDACFLPVASRLAKRLVELAEAWGVPEEEGILIDLKLTQTDLASMVGATRESVNKEMAVLKKDGIIGARVGKTLIVDMERLRRRARL